MNENEFATAMDLIHTQMTEAAAAGDVDRFTALNAMSSELYRAHGKKV